MGCNNCPHVTCPHALPQLSVCDCNECEEGVLVLDPASGPCWRLACNSSQYACVCVCVCACVCVHVHVFMFGHVCVHLLCMDACVCLCCVVCNCCSKFLPQV